MNWLLIIVVGILLVGVLVGFVRGAVRIAVSLVATLFTIAVVFVATPYVSKAVISLTPVDEMLEKQCIHTVTKLISGGQTAEGLTEEQVRAVLAGAGVTEEQLATAGITVQDIVDGKVSGEDLAKYGISPGILEGHTQEKATQLLTEYGENVIEEQEQKSILQVFLGQFADLLVIILIIAAVISMFSGNIESTIVILTVIFINAILGTVQYVNAVKSVDSLKELSAPKAKVLRDGVKVEVASKEIVPGDILLLEAGDMVAADGRIIENYSLQVNESALTGESTNVEKNDRDIDENVALGDRTNMVFSGSLVTYGRAKVIVTATGMKTEMGKIAVLMNNAKNKKQI